MQKLDAGGLVIVGSSSLLPHTSSAGAAGCRRHLWFQSRAKLFYYIISKELHRNMYTHKKIGIFMIIIMFITFLHS